MGRPVLSDEQVEDFRQRVCEVSMQLFVEHGYEGFTTFSKMRPVFYQGPVRAMDMLMPPYAGRANRILNFMLKMKS